MKKVFTFTMSAIALVALTACEPERGSDAWCKKMDGVPKGEWTLQDAGDYTKYCVLNQKPGEEQDNR
ncbi:DUF3012 domain-containing protein [Microbulbifer yueqingensis]|uniref:DUF3012 domain-containing protein n=1 Tax=Microbulbifer yueqingensis TaxID=658219 RepID=A0A1G9AD87_9GAMM|nr:DUF3012 domain-containing protein [Microbulbifer yueqingensis]SDK24774.1 Protein of unknown function [Microbulbifer yueqingensis]